MQRLSSRMTFFYKRVLPVVMLGFLLLVIAPPIASGKFPPFPFTLFPIIGVAVVYFFAAGLMDEVWDAGGALIVRNKRREDRIPLASIMSVDYSRFVNPPRVTLKLRTPSIFGDSVIFCGPVRMMPFTDSPVDDVIRRVDAARMRAR